MPSRSRSSASRRAAGLVGVADQVVVGVDGLDDAGCQRHVAAVALVRPAVGLGLLVDDGATPSSTPVCRITSAPSVAMRRWSAGAATTVAPARDGLGEGELADVVHQRRVLQVAQLGVAHAQLAADRHGQLADPARVPGLGVAAELGDPGQRPDGLQGRLADRGVAAERELGQQQRHDEDRQRPEAHDGGGQRDQRAGRADGGADADLGPDLVAQHGRERRAVGSGPHRRGEHRVDDQGGEDDTRP